MHQAKPLPNEIIHSPTDSLRQKPVTSFIDSFTCYMYRNILSANKDETNNPHMNTNGAE